MDAPGVSLPQPDSWQFSLAVGDRRAVVFLMRRYTARDGEEAVNTETLDSAIRHFQTALLQLDVTKEVPTTDIAKAIRYLAFGLEELAQAHKS